MLSGWPYVGSCEEALALNGELWAPIVRLVAIRCSGTQKQKKRGSGEEEQNRRRLCGEALTRLWLDPLHKGELWWADAPACNEYHRQTSSHLLLCINGTPQRLLSTDAPRYKGNSERSVFPLMCDISAWALMDTNRLPDNKTAFVKKQIFATLAGAFFSLWTLKDSFFFSLSSF